MCKRTVRAASIFIIASIATFAFVTIVWAFPSGWRIPSYNDGRAMISNGPGEGMHTGSSAGAIDFLPMDTWSTTKDVRSASPGTVKFATTYSCSGVTLGIQDTNGRSSFYYHLSSVFVAVGQSVARDEVVADYDNTGSCTTGPHLHFEGRSMVNWDNPLGSGTPLTLKDLRFVGWYPWWPNPDRFSGFVVQSTSHSVTNCSTDRTVDIRWPVWSSVVGGSFIDGYSWSWTTSSSSIPDNVKEGEQSAFSTTSPSLSDGTWWFHLKVRDTSGNWTKDSDVAHSGPFCISSAKSLYYGEE